ncbi:MAG: Rhs element Vgr protein [Gammaproteobacteria bacterium]
MASLLFRDAIDYQHVRIHARRYLPFQPRTCAMTPNGSMYFHRSCFLPDYTRGDPAVVHWFMHEMVHVWQHQLGYPVRLRGAVRIGLPYHYTLEPGKTLADFNMEAQGDVLADYFVLRYLGVPQVMRQREYASRLDLFEQVLSGFLRAPGAQANLPRGVARRLVRPALRR